MRIVVIIPVYNEAERILSVVKGVKKLNLPVVVVDDGSRDGSAAQVRGVADVLLQHRINLGKGAALKTGVEYAWECLNADAVILMDGDGQHDPAELSHFVRHLESGAEVVFGVRDVWRNMPWQRTFGNRCVSWIIARRWGAYVPDILSGYKAFHRNRYPQLRWEAQGYEVEVDLTVRVARHRIPFVLHPIQTIYLNFDRGMNIIDAVALGWKVPLW